MKRIVVLFISLLLLGGHLVAWEPAFNLSSSGRPSQFPRLAVDHQGVIHAVWTEFESSAVANVYYRRHDRNGWSAAENLSNSGCPSREASIAVDRAGNVYVVWLNNFSCPVGLRGLALLTMQAHDGGRTLNYLPFTMHSSWDELKLPSIASDDDGNLSIVAYTGHRKVWGLNRDHGRWSEWKIINTPNIMSASESAYVTWGRNGRFYAVWPEYAPGRDLHYSIYYTSRLVGQDWEAPKTTRHDNVPLDNPQAHPKIVVDDKGDMHIVWMNHPLGILEIYYQRWDNTARAWVDRAFVSQRGSLCTLPTITVTRSGVRYVAWALGPWGNLFNAFYNFAPSGESFQPAVRNFFRESIVNPYFTQIESGGPNENVFFIYEQGPQNGKDVYFTSLFPVVIGSEVRPPVELSGRRLSTIRINPHFNNQFNLLQWSDDPQNAAEGVEVSFFRVFRREIDQSDQMISMLAEVPLDSPRYVDYNIEAHKTYLYQVAAVDAEGNESERVSVVVERP